jgi:hypothetical protein
MEALCCSQRKWLGLSVVGGIKSQNNVASENIRLSWQMN